MIWNYKEKAKLTMIKFNQKQIIDYLSKISDQNLYAYNVYQIEGEGRNLFSSIEGDENTNVYKKDIYGVASISTISSGVPVLE